MPIDRIRRIAQSFVPGRYVTINDNTAVVVESLIKKFGFPVDYKAPGNSISIREFTAELCFNAINFSYWENTCDFRPAGGSGEARRLCFAHFGLPSYPNRSIDDAAVLNSDSDPGLQSLIQSLAGKFENSAFPLSFERSLLIHEIANNVHGINKLWGLCFVSPGDEDKVFEALLYWFPGFASDPFAKRALLFFMILKRVYGQCQNIASRLPLPADYQVPKVLRAIGALSYSPELTDTIETEAEIVSGSVIEMEIRAASIVVVSRMARLLGKTEDEIDEWLWAVRKSVDAKYHLTRTTFY